MAFWQSSSRPAFSAVLLFLTTHTPLRICVGGQEDILGRESKKK
jgi:hypothetical protein